MHSQLLDSFTIATVMVLSFIFLRVRYKIINLMGVCLALIGIVSLVLADLQGSRVEHGEREREKRREERGERGGGGGEGERVRAKRRGKEGDGVRNFT